MKNEYKGESDFDCCSLCLDDFKDPRILPCFHSFCRGCLAEYLAKKVGSTFPGNSFECPLCRAKSDVPKEGIDGIQKNFYLVKSKSVYPMCNEHENEDLRFYCRNCDFKICRDCKVISHEGHLVDMTKRVYSEVKSKCKDILNVTERNIIEREIQVRGAFESDILALDKAFSSIDKYLMRIKGEIDTFVKDIKGTLKHQQRHKTDSLVKIEAWFDEKRKTIAEEKQRILEVLASEERDSFIKVLSDLVSKVDEVNMEEEPSILAEHEIDASGFESAFQQLNETICNAVRKFKLHVAKKKKNDQDDKPKGASALKESEEEFSNERHDQDDKLKGAYALKESEEEFSDSSDWELYEARVRPSKSMDEMLGMVQKEEAGLRSEGSRQRRAMPDSVNIIAGQENKTGEDGRQYKTKEVV